MAHKEKPRPKAGLRSRGLLAIQFDNILLPQNLIEIIINSPRRRRCFIPDSKSFARVERYWTEAIIACRA